MISMCIEVSHSAEDEFLRAGSSKSISENSCFLCGRQLRDNADQGNSFKKQKEDVVPKWIQRAFNAGNFKVIISNGTTVPVSKILVPSCPSCNNVKLSAIEAKVADFVKGLSQDIDRWHLDTWLLKLFKAYPVRTATRHKLCLREI